MNIKYNLATLGFVNVFESLTKAKVKDCFLDDNNKQLIFIVEEGEMGKAIGKGGEKIKVVGQALKKNIKVIEFKNDVVKFIENIIYPLKSKIYITDSNIVNIEAQSVMDRGIIIGRDKKNLKKIKDMINKYFNITEIKVL